MELMQQDINFFKTFGYLRFRGFFSAEQIKMLQDEWQYNDTPVVYSYIEKNPKFLGLYEETLLHKIIDELAGPNAAYAGSDGSQFTGGSDWHRDWYLKLPSIKVACYLQSSQGGTGDFRCVPGSHIAGDRYADAVGKGCAWPDQGAGLSGVFSGVPYITIPITEGDLLIFDNRLVHSVSGDSEDYKRRLITMIFLANPKDFTDAAFKDFHRHEVVSEIFHLKEMELAQLDGDMEGLYPEWMFNEAKYPNLQPHLQMLKNLRVMEKSKSNALDVLRENLKFFKQNYLLENILLTGGI